MGLTIGTNCGFVTIAPTSDPTDSEIVMADKALVLKDTTPSGSNLVITEIGWYQDQASSDTNFEVGLYAADGAVVPNEAGTLSEVSRTNAKEGDADGWYIATGLNWSVTAETVYWIGIQVDSAASNNRMDYNVAGGPGIDAIDSATTLPGPFGGGALSAASGIAALYALVGEAAAPSGTNQLINIGDTWENISEMFVNVGDVWKSVDELYVNVGDVWKPGFTT